MKTGSEEEPTPAIALAHEVRSALRAIIDPELGVNIVDLGLIYEIEVIDHDVRVAFTLTTPHCPLQYAMAAGIRNAVMGVAGVADCTVKLVWDPPWNPGLISPEGRELLSAPRTA